MKKLINKILKIIKLRKVEKLKKNSNYDYYTITINGVITNYIFYKVA